MTNDEYLERAHDLEVISASTHDGTSMHRLVLKHLTLQLEALLEIRLELNELRADMNRDKGADRKSTELGRTIQEVVKSWRKEQEAS